MKFVIDAGKTFDYSARYSHWSLLKRSRIINLVNVLIPTSVCKHDTLNGRLSIRDEFFGWFTYWGRDTETDGQ